MKIKIYTGITNGFPQDSLEEAFKCFEGKQVDITIENHKTIRTTPQNKYWRGIVLPLISEFLEEVEGIILSQEQIHEIFIHDGYFGYKKIELHGEEKVYPKRSSEATTLEFNFAIDRVQKEFALRGLVIPDPNQKNFI